MKPFKSLSKINYDWVKDPVQNPTPEQIKALNDLVEIYSELSPENLSCDGELPMHLIRKRQRELTVRLAKAYKKFGRKVSEGAVYQWTDQQEESNV